MLAQSINTYQTELFTFYQYRQIAMIDQMLIEQEYQVGIEAFSQSITRYYLNVLATNLQQNSVWISNIQKLFSTTIQSIKLSTSSRQFCKTFARQHQRIKKRSHIQFHEASAYARIKETLQTLQTKDKGYESIQKLLASIKMEKVACKLFKNHKCKRLIDLISFLNEQDIDIHSKIKPQVHQKWLTPNKIQVPYSGIHTAKGQIHHEDMYLEQLLVPIQIEVQFKGSRQYQKVIHISGEKDYTGTTQVQKCSCGYYNPFSGTIRTQCHNCSHYQIDLPYSGTRRFQINEKEVGEKEYQKIEHIQRLVKISTISKCEVDIPYEEVVSYSGSSIAICQDHHECSCYLLAQLLQSAKQTSKEVEYYFQLNKMQRKTIRNKENYNNRYNGCQRLINKQRKDQIAQNQYQGKIILQYQSIISEYSAMGFDLLEKQLSIDEIASQIHEYLCNDYNFSANFLQKSKVKIQKNFQKNIHIEGKTELNGKLKYSSDICYNNLYAYGGQLTYKGKVPYQICYENCRYCFQEIRQMPYEGNVRIIEAGIYFGNIPIQQSQQWLKQIPFDHDVKISDTASKEIIAEFPHQCIVNCKKVVELGGGHHTCTSCDLWDFFVTKLKDLLQIKSQLSDQILKNRDDALQLSND